LREALIFTAASLKTVGFYNFTLNIQYSLACKYLNMLATEKIKAFVPTLNPANAKQFYSDVLGLTLLSEDNYALQYDANGTFLRVTTVQAFQPHPFTVLGWSVKDIAATITELTAKGVVFERYSFVEQDDSGIWTAPGGTKVAWFKDPDGNLLSLDSQ